MRDALRRIGLALADTIAWGLVLLALAAAIWAALALSDYTNGV